MCEVHNTSIFIATIWCINW